MPSRFLAWLVLPACWLAGCALAPDAAPAGGPGRITVVLGDFPVLNDGMTAAEVRAKLGEPAEIKATPSVNGSGEIWTYYLEKYLGKTQVVTHLEPRAPSGALGGDPMAGFAEPVYTMVDEKLVVTLHLLFNHGQLVYQVARSQKVFGS
ncbi:MAG TPA: hypothetical protein VHD61_10110 [Lacunisphaera sp.]|nr:hypothetical protein [Lacunisphaera sp.]